MENNTPLSEQSESRLHSYQNFLNQLTMAAMIVNTEYQVVYLNPRAEKLLAVSLAEVAGKPCSCLGIAMCGTSGCILQQLQQGNTVSSVFRHGGKSCQTFAAEFGKEQDKGYLILLRDTSQTAASSRQQGGERGDLSLALAQMFHFIWEYEVATHTLTLAGGSLKDYNLRQCFTNAPESLITEKIIYPQDAPLFMELFAQVLAGNPQASCTIRCQKQNGEYGWVKLSCIGLGENGRQPTLIVGVLEDIDQQKRIELRFLQEEEYRRSFTVDALSSYEFNLTQNQLVLADPASAHLFGVKKGDTYDEMAALVAAKTVHPDDRQMFLQQVNRQAMVAAFEAGKQELEFECRSIDRQGKQLWVRHTVHLIREPMNGDVCSFAYIKNIDEKKRRELTVQARAERDSMTGLYNRNTLQVKIDQRLKNNEAACKAAFYMIDVDAFKQANDHFGHVQGDHILMELSRRLDDLFPSGSLLGRIGGDEFAVFTSMEDTEQGCRLAAALCEQLRQVIGREFISVSVGVAFVPQHGVDFQSLYEKADVALYQAKESGKNRYAVYNQDLHVQGKNGACHQHPVIDELEEIVYICDLETYELKYINRMGRKVFGLELDNYQGKRCYETLHHSEQPCEFCTNPFLRYGEYYIWEHKNLLLDKHYLLKDKLIEWENRPARMEIAIDITEKENVSQKLRSRLELEQILLDCIRTLSGAESLEKSVTLVLAKLASYYQADRAYILEFDFEQDLCSNTFEWCMDGVSPQRNELQNVPLSIAPDWKISFETQRPILWESLEKLRFSQPQEWKLLAEQGIHSLYGMPFAARNSLAGFVGVDNPSQHLGDISLLESLAYFLANEVAKRRMDERLQFFGYHDRLTGVYNRNAFAAVAERFEHKQPACVGVLVADINGMKWLNNNFGHDYGDRVICQVAAVLKARFDNAYVFRLSGDEFVVVWLQPDAAAFRQQCEAAAAALAEIENGVSLGYIWSDLDVNMQRLIRHADELMMVQKQVYYQAADSVAQRHRPERVRRLKAALAAGNFEMFLQPKQNVITGEICGAEALVRYRDEKNGLIAPGLFIPLLEKDCLVREIDFFIFEEVCRTPSRWQQEGRKLLPISLNFSRTTLMESGLTDKLLEIYNRYSAPVAFIEIEITESAGAMEQETLWEIGVNLTKLGFRIALDDFGSQYSSTVILSLLPWSVLKIDRSLINELTADDKNRIIIRHMLEMCREMDIDVVVEGVETEDQLQVLKALGCRCIQGNLFGKPQSLEEFEASYFSDGVTNN